MNIVRANFQALSRGTSIRLHIYPTVHTQAGREVTFEKRYYFNMGAENQLFRQGLETRTSMTIVLSRVFYCCVRYLPTAAVHRLATGLYATVLSYIQSEKFPHKFSVI
jgi:hypothetical protein